MANSDLVQSVAKALDVLKYIASTPGGCRLCDLAAHFGMKPPALHNILRTMTDRGFLRKAPGGVYSAGDALLEIAFDEIGDAIRDTAFIKTADTANGTWALAAVQTGSAS